MRLSLANDGLPTWSGEVLAVGLFKDQPATELEGRWPGLSNTLNREQFSGKPGQQLVVNLLEGSGPQRLVVLGLGDAVGTVHPVPGPGARGPLSRGAHVRSFLASTRNRQ